MGEDDLRDVTRDLRKSTFLVEAIDLVLTELTKALEEPPATRERAIRAVLHRHLGIAWDDGSAKATDLKQAVELLRGQVELLKKSNRELLKRVSDGRIE